MPAYISGQNIIRPETNLPDSYGSIRIFLDQNVSNQHLGKHIMSSQWYVYDHHSISWMLPWHMLIILSRYIDLTQFHRVSHTPVEAFTDALHSHNDIQIVAIGPWKSVGTWRRHYMETLSMLLAICAGNYLIAGELSSQRAVTSSFDVFPNKRFTKQWIRQWLETSLRSLWRHCNVPTGNIKTKVCYNLHRSIEAIHR